MFRLFVRRLRLLPIHLNDQRLNTPAVADTLKDIHNYPEFFYSNMDSGLFGSLPSFDTNTQSNMVERSYIHLKVSRARWAPVPDGQVPSHLVTGSYSELSNSIDLWSCPRDKQDGSPRSVAKSQVAGDVTELKFVDPRRFLASTGKGELWLFKVEGDQLVEMKKWDKSEVLCDADSFSAFDSLDGLVALVTTEGQVLCFPYADTSKAHSSMINPDGKDGVKAISFIRHNEIALGNLRGQMSIWDLRENLFTPAMTFPYNADSAIGITRICPFPLQKHVLVASGCDGTLSTWDLRNVTKTQTIYAAHDKAVTDLRFHDLRPGNAFTCSFAGDVWHWTNFDELLGASVSSTSSIPLGGLQPNVNCLLPVKKFPVNSVDVCGDTLVSSCDNDSLVFVKNLRLK